MKKDNAVMRSVPRGQWYVNAAGTGYKRDMVAVERKDYTPPSRTLKPLLEGEAAGDLELAIIIAVRNVIRTPEVYCNTARALSKSGRVVDPTCSDAVRWNLFGALEYVTSPHIPVAKRREIIQLIKRCLPKEHEGMALFKWEETHPHGRVLHLLNTAIGRRKQDADYLPDAPADAADAKL